MKKAFDISIMIEYVTRVIHKTKVTLRYTIENTDNL